MGTSKDYFISLAKGYLGSYRDERSGWHLSVPSSTALAGLDEKIWRVENSMTLLQRPEMMYQLAMRAGLGLEEGRKDRYWNGRMSRWKQASPKLAVLPTASHALELPLLQVLYKVSPISSWNNTLLQHEIMSNIWLLCSKALLDSRKLMQKEKWKLVLLNLLALTDCSLQERKTLKYVLKTTSNS